MKKKVFFLFAAIGLIGLIALNAIPLPADPSVQLQCTDAIPMTDNWGYCTYEYNMNPPFEAISAACAVTDGYKNCDGVEFVPN